MTRKRAPPDGGWGWAVVIALAVNYLIAIPVMQCFGMIFTQTFSDLGLSHTDRSTIMNTNSAFGMLTGLINGALLKKFGFRKVGITGSVLMSVGIILTSFAKTFAEYMIYYGLITSFGIGLGMSSFTLALNTYFEKRRGMAMAIAMTITGFGPVFMPQLISYLMTVHTTQGAVFIVGGISLHSVAAALLLQPVEWHLKEVGDVEKNGEPEADDEKNKDTSAPLIEPEKNTAQKPITHSRKNSILGSQYSMDDVEINSIYGYDTPLATSLLSLTPGPHRSPTIENIPEETTRNRKWWSATSLNSIKLGSSSKIFEENNSNNANNNTVYHELSVEKKKPSFFKKLLRDAVNFFDLKLLCDPFFVNILIGMSLAITAELNFSILTPFILADMGLKLSQIATFLSTLSVADIVFRFLAPHIGEYLKKPPRKMYMLTLLFLIITRFLLLIFSTYSSLLAVAVCLGVAKGVRTVYMNLVMPSAVPLDKLAIASGMQMVTNGIFLIIGGPLIGVIRDYTGSYSNCITVMNTITFSCILMWSTEMIYVGCKKPIEANVEEQKK